MKGDLSEAFERLKETMFIKYRGCTIYQGLHQSVWNDNVFPNTDAAKAAIDAAHDILRDSVLPSKTG